MDIRNDGSMSAVYFANCLEDYINEPLKKNFFKKKVNDYDLKKGTVLISKSEVSSIQWLQKEIDRCYEWLGHDLSTVTIVIVDYFADSKIQVKFIQKKILKGLKISGEPNVVTLQFDEGDYIQVLEDCYDDRFSHKRMSKAYRKGLSQVCKLYRETKASAVKKGRGARYEDRSLV